MAVEQRMLPGVGFVETEDDGEQKQLPGLVFLNEDEVAVSGAMINLAGYGGLTSPGGYGMLAGSGGGLVR